MSARHRDLTDNRDVEIERLRAALREIRDMAKEGASPLHCPFDPYECYADYQKATNAHRDIQKRVTSVLSRKERITR